MANFTPTLGALGRNTLRKISSKDMKHGGLVLAAQVIFRGCMVGRDATAGTIRRGGGVVATFTGGMLGRCMNTRNPAVAGDVAEYEEGIFCWNNIGSITIASIGKPCYADDDQSVSLTNTNAIAGTIEDVTTEGVWVYMGADTRVA